jgi:uncharacterized membrane protein
MTYMTNSELRLSAREALQGNWGNAIVLLIIFWAMTAIGVGIAITFGTAFNLAVSIFGMIPLQCALFFTYLGFVNGSKKLEPAELFCTFNKTYYWKCISVVIIQRLLIFLWTLLLIIPGIIKGLSYSLAPYIVAEQPETEAFEVLKLSERMMYGHKSRLFLLLLGFIALSILAVCTFGLLFLWLIPFYQTTMAKFYVDVKEQYSQTA